MKYKLVIFDCDGTLVDSEPITMKLIAEMLTDFGIHKDPQYLHDLFAGKNLTFITDFIEEHAGLIDKKAFELDYRRRCEKMFKDDLKTIPGVKELIESLTVPCCIASNGPHEKMDVTLSVTGIDKLIAKEHIFSAYDIKKWKPDPSLIYYAMKKMNCTALEAVLVEDTLSGVNAGLNAGVDTLAYNPHNDEELSQSGALNFSSMEEINNYLQES